MVEALHGEELAVDGVVGLIQQRAAGRHLWVGEHRIPPRFLGLKPAPARARHALLPPSWRCERQSGVGAGPRPLPAGFSAVDTGAAGRRTSSVIPGARGPTSR